MVIVLPTSIICIHGHLIGLVVTLLNTNLQLSVTFQTPQWHMQPIVTFLTCQILIDFV